MRTTGRSYISPSRCFWAYAKAFRFWSVSCAPLSPQGGHGFQILALLGLQIGVVHGFNSANHVLGSSLQLLQAAWKAAVSTPDSAMRGSFIATRMRSYWAVKSR